jgi:cell wall-associated NlpC family hydrolase
MLAAAVGAGCSGSPAVVDRPSGELEPGERVFPQNPGSTVVLIALEFVGTPYRAGGTSTRGVDCSGLAFAVYGRIGVRLPRTSEDQARTGQRVERAELHQGDLLFFAGDGGASTIGHVGIYTGRGEFIHASTRSRSVRFDRLDNKYFANRYVIARRVL